MVKKTTEKAAEAKETEVLETEKKEQVNIVPSLFTDKFDDEQRAKIEQAGEEAREAFEKENKKPRSKHKTGVGALMGTFILPIIGTLFGAVAGSKKDSASMIVYNHKKETVAHNAMLQEAENLGFEGEDLQGFIYKAKEHEVKATNRHEGTHKATVGSVIGGLILGTITAIIGAIWGKKSADKEDNKKDTEAHAAARAEVEKYTGKPVSPGKATSVASETKSIAAEEEFAVEEEVQSEVSEATAARRPTAAQRISIEAAPASYTERAEADAEEREDPATLTRG